MSKEVIAPKTYSSFLDEIKEKIKQARYAVALSANRTLLLLYWDIGRTILQRQKKEGWGSKVISKLADDLVNEFPDVKGLSRRNLIYMRKFAEAYPNFVQEPLAQIPWYHHITLLEKVKNKSSKDEN